MPHADDTSPDPLRLPQDDLLGAMPFGDEPAAERSSQSETADALMLDAGAAVETPVEPADGKTKKREKKKKDRKEKKPADAEAAKKPGAALLTKISRASPYTVMLAIALGSLVIGVSVLALYLSTYAFKIHP